MRGRCSTYPRIRAAIHTPAHAMEGQVMIFRKDAAVIHRGEPQYCDDRRCLPCTSRQVGLPKPKVALRGDSGWRAERSTDVRLGSKADIQHLVGDVRFSLNTGHRAITA
jgi:hypothetical protein